MKKLAILIASIVAAGTLTEGRQAPADVPPQFAGAVRKLDPPEAPGAWVVQVLSRGGLGGRGTGDRAISSAGGLTLFDPGTTGAVPPDRLHLLGEYVRTSTPAHWTSISASVCSDCVTTLMVLRVRDASGAVQTRTVSWDPTTRGKVPAEVLRIYDFVSVLK